MASTISASPVVITYQTIPNNPGPQTPVVISSTINTQCKDGKCATTTTSPVAPAPVPASAPATPKSDCVEGYQTTGTCTSGKNIQTWVISKQPTKDGKPCATPTPPEKSIDCTDCVSEWTPWTECKDGKQSRSYKTVKEPTNGGKLCETKTETKSCSSESIPMWLMIVLIVLVIFMVVIMLMDPAGALKAIR